MKSGDRVWTLETKCGLGCQIWRQRDCVLRNAECEFGLIADGQNNRNKKLNTYDRIPPLSVGSIGLVIASMTVEKGA